MQNPNPIRYFIFNSSIIFLNFYKKSMPFWCDMKCENTVFGKRRIGIQVDRIKKSLRFTTYPNGDVLWQPSFVMLSKVVKHNVFIFSYSQFIFLFSFLSIMYRAPYTEALQFRCILCTMTINKFCPILF